MKSSSQASEARKEYLQKYLTEYRKKNKTKLLEINQEWRDRNRAKMRDYSRNYARAYTLRNKEKIREYKRAWYAKRMCQKPPAGDVLQP